MAGPLIDLTGEFILRHNIVSIKLSNTGSVIEKGELGGRKVVTYLYQENRPSYEAKLVSLVKQ